MPSFVDRWLTAFENFCIAVGTAVAVSVATIQVILRYVGGTGLFWAEELVVYTLIWTAFLAASAAVRTGEHLTVELIYLILGPRHTGTIVRITGIIGLAAAVALAILGIDLVMAQQEYGQLSPALQMPMWIVYLAMPLSGFLMALRFIQNIIAPPDAHQGPAAIADTSCP